MELVFSIVLVNGERRELGLYDVPRCCFCLVSEWYDVYQYSHGWYEVVVKSMYSGVTQASSNSRCFRCLMLI